MRIIYNCFNMYVLYPTKYGNWFFCSKSRQLSKSEYGKGRKERARFRYQFYCDGTEDTLSDCLGDSSVDCTSDNDVVAVQCTNTGLYFEHHKNDKKMFSIKCMFSFPQSTLMWQSLTYKILHNFICCMLVAQKSSIYSETCLNRTLS